MEKKVQSRFYPGDLMARTDTRSVSGRLSDNPGELARMLFPITISVSWCSFHVLVHFRALLASHLEQKSWGRSRLCQGGRRPFPRRLLLLYLNKSQRCIIRPHTLLRKLTP